jgi:hypothetical protein
MFRYLVTFLFALAMVASAMPLASKRADLTVQPACTDKATVRAMVFLHIQHLLIHRQTLVSHDCNAALLALGGGIAGTIEFLKVQGTTTTGTSGGCSVSAIVPIWWFALRLSDLVHLPSRCCLIVNLRLPSQITADAVDGGTAINISKGRLEQGFKDFLATCGVSPGTVTITGGSTGGNTQLTVAAA